MKKLTTNEARNLDLSKPGTYSIYVTPELAQDWMDRLNVGNRRWRTSAIDRHADSMARDLFVENHPHGLMFGEDGNLMTGQHRLMGLIKSGVPGIWFRVETGCPLKMREVTDDGIPQRIHDRVRFTDDPDTNKNVASICGAAVGNIGAAGYKRKPLAQDCKDYFEKHREAVLFAAAYMSRRVVGISRVAICVALAEMYERSPDEAIEFSNSLATVDGPVQQARVLRDWCLRAASKMIAGGSGMVLWYKRSVYCMQAALDGREIRSIRDGSWRNKAQEVFEMNS